MILAETLREGLFLNPAYTFSLVDENLSKMCQYFPSFLNSIKNLTLVWWLSYRMNNIYCTMSTQECPPSLTPPGQWPFSWSAQHCPAAEQQSAPSSFPGEVRYPFSSWPLLNSCIPSSSSKILVSIQEFGN